MRFFVLGSIATALLWGQDAIPRNQAQPEVERVITTTDGQTIRGNVVNEGSVDLQVRESSGRIRLLRKMGGGKYRVVTSQTDWPTYNGQVGGNRYSTLTQIGKGNVARLAPQWVFSLGNPALVETTPLVIEGVMYLSSANEVWALDAGTGRQLWRYRRARTQGIAGNAAQGFSRGVAAAGERIFLLTDNAHLIALNRSNGELLWETPMADSRENYNGTSAPLIAGWTRDLRNRRGR
ncbi:MAG: PQQ-binding-like beta-propeller repeat protein [Acidobacteriota bacterium]